MATTHSQYPNIFVGRTLFNLVQKASLNRNHDQVIDLSTDLIIQAHQQELIISVLDLRSQAFGMKGQFEKAVQDAEDIIWRESIQAIGYLRLGKLLSIQGKQSAAIEVYEKALTKVQDDDPSYSELIRGKKKAMEKKELKLDFTTIFPLELVDSVFKYLPEKIKVTCADVSTGWRDRLIKSQMTWLTIENKGYTYRDGRFSVAVLHVMPDVAKHVELLIIGDINMESVQTYLEYLKNGNFKRIKYLRLLGAYKLISTAMFKLFARALWQMRNTLTKLELRIDDNQPKNTETKIIDLLFYSPHLKTLILQTCTSLASSMGNVEFLERPHLALEDVEITTYSTTKSGLEPLIQYCPNLRRLYLPSGGKSCVIDVVGEICNENLQIFAYNNLIPNVSTLEKMDREYYDGPPGLREILISPFQTNASTKNLLGLLHKNQKSLQTVFANLTSTNEQQRSGELYTRLHFERIQQFVFHVNGYNATNHLLPKRITFGNTTPLQLFSVGNTPNLPMITDSLINIPPVKILELAKMKFDDGLNDERSASLTKLFQYYAALMPREQNLCEVSISCCDFITEQVLFDIAQLGSLRTIKLSGNETIPSTATLKEFLNEVSGRVTQVELNNISYVNDCVLEVLARMENLEKISLSNTNNVTKKGLMYLVDNAKALNI